MFTLFEEFNPITTNNSHKVGTDTNINNLDKSKGGHVTHRLSYTTQWSTGLL